MNNTRFGNITFAPTANFELMKSADDLAKQKGIRANVGSIFTSDIFYDEDMERKRKLLASYGIMAIDMETSELYTLAAKNNVDALTLLTVSDNILTGEKCSTDERQKTFNQMIELALEII